MAVECIHGLDEGLCDLCYPKPAPEVEPRAARTAPRRAALSSTTKTATKAAPRTPIVSVGDQRIYHVTHIRNLAGILASGCLMADASDAWTSRPTVDISSADTRELRRATDVAAGWSVASYVPFFLAPNATVWEGFRSGAADPRLSPGARDLVASDFIILVSTITHAGADGMAVTDGDAAHALTRFATTPEASERMLRRMRNDTGDDRATILDAEFLVQETFSFRSVTLVGVANDRERDRVKAILQPSAFGPKVAVYPPWFQRPDAI